MILHDFSSLVHRSVHNAVKNSNPKVNPETGKFYTEHFIPHLLNKLLYELIQVDTEHSSEFGELVLCLDDHSKKYWRNDFYPHYKEHRKGARDESEVDYKEVFKYINELVQVLKDSGPWKVFEVKGAEADDTIAVLAKRYAMYEKILIQSPDKDMIQLHKYGENGSIRQYSSLTNKWVTAEDKVSAEDWLIEHVCLGDSSDGVPRIVDHTEFSEPFLEYLKINKMDKICPSKFNDLTTEKQQLIIKNYSVYNKNRKGEDTDLDIFVKPRFGISNLHKEIKKFGSLANFINSNILYKKHYDRNAVLVLEENMPQEIILDTIKAFQDAKSTYNKAEIFKFISKYELDQNLKLEFGLLDGSRPKEELTVDNCGW